MITRQPDQRRDHCASSDEIREHRLALFGFHRAELRHGPAVDADHGALAAAGASDVSRQISPEFSNANHVYASVHISIGAVSSPDRRMRS